MSLTLHKTCNTCNEQKPHDEYYRHPKTADRLLGKCKDCHKAAIKKNRRENPAVRAYDRQRAKLPDRKAKARTATIRWRKENPDGYKAQTAVGNAIRDGKLIREPCEACGSEDNVHAHHEDYSRPLDVQWLCALHHHRHHAASR